MELVLAGLRWGICLAYLDDIVVFGHTFEEHLQRLRIVLIRLRDANLKLNPKKCQFSFNRVSLSWDMLSHAMELVQIQPKLSALKNGQHPSTSKNCKVFLAWHHIINAL